MVKAITVAVCVASACILTGCAERRAVRQSAKVLQQSMMLYEQRLDGLIASQHQYYAARSGEYQRAHSLLLREGGQQKIIQQAATLADHFSAQPDSSVNIPDLFVFLRASDQCEYDLQTTIRKDLAEKESEFQSSLRNLERDRDTATLIRQNLGRIGASKSLKEEALQLKDYGEQVSSTLEKQKTKDFK